MRRFKMFITLLITSVLLFSLSGCGSDKEDDNKNGNITDETDDLKVTPDAGAKEDDDTGTEEDKDNTSVDETDIDSDKVTIQEQVLFDKEKIKITAISMEEDIYLGPEIKLMIENNGDTDVTVQARELSINGFMIEPVFSTEVAAGKKSNDSLAFYVEELEANGIDKIASIDFKFDIFSTETWDTLVESDTIILETSAKGKYEQKYDTSGKNIYDDSNFKIIDKGLDISDEIMGPQIRLYIENNSSEGITVQVRDVSINGFMIEPAFSREISPGKKANDGISFWDLEENDIVDITDVELKFDIFNTETWDTIVETDVIKLQY
ncbi:MAG TPA: hypothetical protein VJ888_05755 [Mobilitalea sp.]|nr:hypothetical protein [Mobilitalea sp.]